MNQHLFYTPDIMTSFELPDEEAAHCLRVLRLGTGDEVMLTDGKGCFYKAELTVGAGPLPAQSHVGAGRVPARSPQTAVAPKSRENKCSVRILETIRDDQSGRGRLTIAVSPTKNVDRMEWFAEKATEVGIDEIVFLECRYSERRTLKTDRIEKIVVSAMKQSLKSRKPEVTGMTKFNDFVSREFTGQKFIAHCHEGEKPLLRDVLSPGEDVVVLIGPEGDFSEEEVALAVSKGFRPVSLGKSRLRTETAALVAVICNDIYL